MNATREQLAAMMVEDDGACLVIHGTPGDWSVAVSPTEGNGVWLSSERRRTELRCFKSLDAAHAAAVAVHQLGFPLHRGLVSVAVKVSSRP